MQSIHALHRQAADARRWNRRIERELSRQIEQALADARGPASPTSTR